MNIPIKTPQQVEIMARGGKILAATLFAVLEAAKPGVTELELDRMAEDLIRKAGGEPGFQKVPGYKHTICISTNDVVVHGIPTDYKLRKGDIVGVDCGVFLEGFHTDMSESFIVGGVQGADPKAVDFLQSGKEALMAGIAQVKSGNRIGHISQAIQEIVEGRGYSVVRELIGHGVGRELHEDPPIPGYSYKRIEKTPLLVEGMTIAVEVIYNMGGREVVYAGIDDWTIKTKDGSLSGLFERSVAVTKDGYQILTA